MEKMINKEIVKLGSCKRCGDQKKVDKFGLCKECSQEVDYEYSMIYKIKDMEY
ncbi:hypothetical protein [Helicovermis profundi]|uniref:Uncharacterized protein n=1 Tax=Helicovermis profundi TaxID=3065157 RepID=A0AAU9EGG0_9FIRM|nr:hypothetical protein HLPR_08190 [Clostridia bacterium S502]